MLLQVEGHVFVEDDGHDLLDEAHGVRRDRVEGRQLLQDHWCLDVVPAAESRMCLLHSTKPCGMDLPFATVRVLDACKTLLKQLKSSLANTHTCTHTRARARTQMRFLLHKSRCQFNLKYKQVQN